VTTSEPVVIVPVAAALVGDDAAAERKYREACTAFRW